MNAHRMDIRRRDEDTPEYYCSCVVWGSVEEINCKIEGMGKYESCAIGAFQ
jgi:hypothetical protein